MKIPRLPFSFSEIGKRISEVFSFEGREVRIIVIVVVSAVFAAVLITVIALSVSNKSTISFSNKNPDAAVADENVPPANKPFLSDFMLYENKLEESFTGVVFSREPLEQWSVEQVEKYWIPPEEILADQLELESEKIIRDIFADVP